MKKASTELVEAVRDALALHRVRTIAPDPELIAKITTVAVLRQLRVMMNAAEVAEIASSVGSDVDWPSADDLFLIANDVEASL